MFKGKFRAEWAALPPILIVVVILAMMPFRVRVEPVSLAAQSPATAASTSTESAEASAPVVAAPVVAAPVAAAPAAAAMAGMDHNAVVAQQPQTIVEYTLRTQLGGDPAMAFIGVGGDIEGVVNPDLTAKVGDLVRITIINGDPTLHDFVIDEFGVTTGELTLKDETVTVEFVATLPGEFSYYCSIPGHRQIGMTGTLTITGELTGEVAGYGAAVTAMTGMNVPAQIVTEPAVADAVSIVRSPTDVPAPIGDREAQNLRIDLETVEVDGILADGTTYRYMTFNGQVPGPMLRIRVGDTVDVHLTNAITSTFIHSIDLHAVTGPGGGAVNTQTLAGQETSFTFKALQPGLYVYHCATASVAHHITSGMYGLILVEPEGGLEPVDHEFYMMQGEMYTLQDFGTKGHLEFSNEKMLDEDPEYYVFNGAAGALTQEDYMLHANVGDSVRIFFGVGGPNKISSFHVIGEIFDRVYDQASITSPPLMDVQTTLVPSGGATMVEFTVDVPGRYVIVDHALSRMERGLAGYLMVEGDENPEIFHSDTAADTSGH